MNLEWNKLRPFNGDVKYGFEELICQLARAEQIENKTKFLRVAAPDGGVESYCILTDNSEYGWQAKFFSKMENSQWNQIDKSFKSAFEKHPNLVKYYICIPLDRADPRITISKGERKGKRVEHFMDKWNKKVVEWQEYVKLKGREIEFEYWGHSEIFDRLSKEENKGKLYYWFEIEEFSDDWFKKRLAENIRNLDKRYTPKLNFDLPIGRVFDGIARDNNFTTQFNSYLHEIIRTFNKVIKPIDVEEVKEYEDTIISLIREFRQECELIDFKEITPIDNNKLSSILQTAKENIYNLIEQLYDLETKNNNEKHTEFRSDEYKYRGHINDFNNLNSSISEFIVFLNSPNLHLSNNPVMLLSGVAGVGKSHLLADIAKKREERNQYSILLLGQHFTDEEPWSQIKKQLQLKCDIDIFLSVFNSKAEACQNRILILIDAINEGEGKKLWYNYIAGFIERIKKYKYLGVVFSVRTSYENIIIPESLIENKELVKVEHKGFENYEYEASKLFFENYEIIQPRIPLLDPEFSNPLFLKLFCEGLFRKGLKEIPDGYEGISVILNFYLESINLIVSIKHNIPIELNLIQKVAVLIASQIAENDKPHLKYEDAYHIIIEFAKVYSIINASQLLQDIISEGILTKNISWESRSIQYEVVYFSYEKFGDHLICSYLIEHYIDKTNLGGSFKEGSRLYKIFENENTVFFNRGIVEALSIQLPEKFGIELYEVAPQIKKIKEASKIFIDSIIWRKGETFHKKNLDYVNDTLINKHGLYDYFLSKILLITSHPKHFFNSDFLHKYLMEFTMADRDAWWTQLVHKQYPGYPDDKSPIKRMIDWAWSDDKRESISDESIRLMCQTMIWFLTSTNRTLRDSATKSIICLLQDRIHILTQLINKFKNVNDRYVLQRVYAIAYGCAVRTSNIESLEILGNCVFENIFKEEYVIPDVLLRDYARGVIEFAIVKGHKFSFEIQQIRPPYKSKLPNSYPTNQEIKKYEYDSNDDGFKDYYWGMNYIINSMKTNSNGQHYGDFGRYIFESAFDGWRVKSQLLSNVAVKMIVEDYGYDVEKHGEFDRGIKRNYFEKSMVEERIGKKYQWIAFYDLLARVSDNCLMYENGYSENAKQIQYGGTWNPFVRDIDPTITIKGNPDNKTEKSWWNPVEYKNWNFSNKEWILKSDDLPNPIEMISVFDNNGNEWLVLDINTSWDEPTEIGEEKYENPKKELWYWIRCYITQKKDFNKLIKWSIKNKLSGFRMPESSNRYELFSREYYWSPSCETFRQPYYNGNDWSEIHDQMTDNIVCKVANTTLNYVWESKIDASKESTISFYKPTEFLFNLLDIQYSKVEGELVDRKGEMICFDPSATRPTHTCLLVRKNEVMKKLEENDLELLWNVLGEKLIIGGKYNKTDNYGRLNISGIVYYENGEQKHIPFFEID